MPPKSGKKKLSKAEKEKLKKEEAEKKLQEEEEAKQKAEQEAKEQKLREKLEAVERIKIENEERRIRKDQMQELMGLWDFNMNIILAEQEDRRKKAKWERYMKCDGSPDPTIPIEINTYMNLWREDKCRNDIKSVLDDAKLPLQLIAELEFLLEDTPSEELSEKDVIRYRQTILDLQGLLEEKFNLATHDVLLSAGDMRDSETSNLQKVFSNDTAKLCIWGNLSKNPRIKSFEFADEGISFEIPRLLTLADCGIRILFTKYDHFSAQCSSCLPRLKKKIEEVPEEVKVEEEKKEETEEEKKEGEEGQLSREETEDVMAALSALNQPGGEEEVKEEEETKEEEEKEPEMEEEYCSKTPEPEEFEDFDGDDDAVDLRAYHVLGGVFHFNLLQLPPQPKAANNWILTQVIEPPELIYMSYVADNVNPQINQTKENDKKEKEGETQKKDERPPIGVHLRLPEDVYFCEEPQVARWDRDDKLWRLDGFSDHSFNEETRTLFFKTSYFGTLCLLQDAHINMPFQSWELRPRNKNHVLLTIIAAIVEVEIEIKDGLCCLTAPADKPELSHLKDKWMKPADFILVMQKSGLNLFPARDSSKYVSIQNKNPIAEKSLYQQMAYSCSSMAYSWSKWNNEIKNDEKLIVQTAEQLEDESLLEEDWKLLLVTKKCAKQLKMTEFDEVLSEDPIDGVNFTSNIYHLVQETASEKAKDRIRDTDFKFVNAVCEILSALKLVTYS